MGWKVVLFDTDFALFSSLNAELRTLPQTLPKRVEPAIPTVPIDECESNWRQLYHLNELGHRAIEGRCRRHGFVTMRLKYIDRLGEKGGKIVVARVDGDAAAAATTSPQRTGPMGTTDGAAELYR